MPTKEEMHLRMRTLEELMTCMSDSLARIIDIESKDEFLRLTATVLRSYADTLSDDEKPRPRIGFR